MRDKIKKIKGTLISGIILFIPVFVILVILQKIFGFLHGFGTKLAKLIGLDSIAGVSVAPVLTTILLLVLFYLSGLLVRYTFVTRAKEWLEDSVLNYVPNYNKYKAKMMNKLNPIKDERKPALVELNNYSKPCLIVSSLNEKTIVFLPSTPDTDYGEVLIVDTQKVKPVDMDIKTFKTSILRSGKGLQYN